MTPQLKEEILRRRKSRGEFSLTYLLSKTWTILLKREVLKYQRVNFLVLNKSNKKGKMMIAEVRLYTRVG